MCFVGGSSTPSSIREEYTPSLAPDPANSFYLMTFPRLLPIWNSPSSSCIGISSMGGGLS